MRCCAIQPDQAKPAARPPSNSSSKRLITAARSGISVLMPGDDMDHASIDDDNRAINTNASSIEGAGSTGCCCKHSTPAAKARIHNRIAAQRRAGGLVECAK